MSDHSVKQLSVRALKATLLTSEFFDEKFVKFRRVQAVALHSRCNVAGAKIMRAPPPTWACAACLLELVKGLDLRRGHKAGIKSEEAQPFLQESGRPGIRQFTVRQVIEAAGSIARAPIDPDCFGMTVTIHYLSGSGPSPQTVLQTLQPWTFDQTPHESLLQLYARETRTSKWRFREQVLDLHQGLY